MTVTEITSRLIAEEFQHLWNMGEGWGSISATLGMTPPQIEVRLRREELHDLADRWRDSGWNTGPSRSPIALKQASQCCRNGHEFTPENTARNMRGDRRCRACARDQKRRERSSRIRPSQVRVLPRFCARGHEYTPENTGVNKKNGSRRCRACDRDAATRARDRRRARSSVAA